jgi:hypothetical protein
VGLIVDGHTTEIPTPKMSFLDAMVFYDGKNGIYGYKNEVAVHSFPPHFCMFVSHHVPASVHDYELHKQVYRNYIEYLHRTPAEIARQEELIEPPFWPVMGDRAYIGPAEDTEPIKRIVPRRGRFLNQQQQGRNRVIDTKRVVIEQFFGRMCHLWAVFRHAWRYDRANFDEDLSIACLLTNEHIDMLDLGPEEAIFRSNMIAIRLQLMREKKARRRARVQLAKTRKQQRLNQAFAIQEARRQPHNHFENVDA